MKKSQPVQRQAVQRQSSSASEGEEGRTAEKGSHTGGDTLESYVK